MNVLKFGGTSVANASIIKQIGDIVKNAVAKDDKTIVVVSAMSGVTNNLIRFADLAKEKNEDYIPLLQKQEESFFETIQALFHAAHQGSVSARIKRYTNELEEIFEGVLLLGDLSDKTKDRIVSYGEIISSHIISAYFNTIGLANEWLDSQSLIKTDSSFGNAIVDRKLSYKNIQNALSKSPAVGLFVAPGFIASNEKNATTTIGRGGSDYSAAIYAAALDAKLLEIWTDVSGMMTADPKIVKHAKYIERISYATALELSHFGAKVIYTPTLEPAMEKKIPIAIKNTFAPADIGTLISDKADIDEKYTGISSIQEIGLLNIRGNGIMKLTHIAQRIFSVLHHAKISVLLTTQGSSEHFLTIAIPGKDALHAKRLMDKEFYDDISLGRMDEPLLETDLSILALVGDNMKDHPGIASRMFSALARNGISMRAIAQGSSERNISAVIGSKNIKKATLILHEEFFEKKYKALHIFIVGVGNVGSKLLEQIHRQKEFIFRQSGLRLKVVGLANSKKMFINEESINLEDPKGILEQGQKMNIEEFAQIIINKNLRNSVFVDVTASKEVAMQYDKLLEKSISVVACNKIACSIDYTYYKKLKELSQEYNASLMFETNVGAALPIIETLNGLIKSGDKIKSIEAVLSGTLNFVFNNYNGKESFASVVKRAQEEGYTEPDPRVDLSGIDVLRKILILSREVGYVMNMEDVRIDPFLPDSVMKASIDDFYTELEKHETVFKKMYDEAKAENSILKYVAHLKEGKASVGLQKIAPESDLYHLYNKDNIVVFYTKRYDQQPLVIKGAGAGADVTASGIFADILKTKY